MNTLNQNSILVTGGTGFAGRYAIKRLVNEGHHVHALVRSSQRLSEALGQNFSHRSLTVIENAQPEKARVEELKTLLEQRQIGTVLHIGAVAREYSGTPWSSYLETNVEWTKTLASAFQQANVPHNKFIFTSTVGVYGTIPQRTPADEETPYNPDGKYHKSKMLAEQELLALKENSDLPLVIVRPSIMYGVGDYGFLYKIFRLSKKKIYPLSSSNPQFHMLDVESLAEVYAKLVKPQSSRFDVMNVCDREPVAAKTLLNYIKNTAQSNYLTVPSSFFAFLKELSKLNAQRAITFKLINESWSYNVSRLEQTLGYESKNTLGNIESKYLQWYRGCA